MMARGKFDLVVHPPFLRYACSIQNTSSLYFTYLLQIALIWRTVDVEYLRSSNLNFNLNVR